MGGTTEDTITQEELDSRHGGAMLAVDDPGFVVLWSSEGDEHLGAWMPIPEGKRRILGRGAARDDDEYPRLRPSRQRPGSLILLEPFEHQALSRVQLVVERVSPQDLHVENVGRRRLSVNGSDTESATVGPGDLVELGSQLVLLCAVRPRKLAGPLQPRTHEFGRADTHGIVGESPAAWQLRADIDAIAPRSGHVLVLGATGTGKELVTRALHASSGVAGPLTSRNAATLPEALVDAELFGNLKDYPNPGMPDRRGLIGAADGGTLFLDEFAELPEKAQAHLLRALDAGEYQRLGETTVRRSSLRLIAATNRPESALRRDLLERFPFRLRVPSLSERREDVPLIIRHLFGEMKLEAPELHAKHANADGMPKLASSFVRDLLCHPFEGNVRELRSLLWGAITRSGELERLERPSVVPDRTSSMLPPADEERERITRALEACAGNQRRAAEQLGMSRRTLVRRIAELGLPRPKSGN